MRPISGGKRKSTIGLSIPQYRWLEAESEREDVAVGAVVRRVLALGIAAINAERAKPAPAGKRYVSRGIA